MDLQFMVNIFPALLRALPVTLTIFAISAVLSLILSVVLTMLRLQKVPVLHPILEAFVSFMRSTPGIVHIFLVYYGLPVLLRAINIDITNIDRTVFAVVALTLYIGAFVSEILRPSYLAVSKQQHEAAVSIGMTSWQRHTRIIFPQMLPIAMPSLTNAMIDLLQDTSLLFLIGLVDIMGQAEIIIANTFGVYQFEVYLTVALIYWVISIVLSLIMSFINNRASKFVR